MKKFTTKGTKEKRANGKKEEKKNWIPDQVRDDRKKKRKKRSLDYRQSGDKSRIKCGMTKKKAIAKYGRRGHNPVCCTVEIGWGESGITYVG